MISRAFVHIDYSSDLLSVDNSSIEYKINSSSSALHYFSTKFPSSNCAKVIKSPVLSWDDIV